MIARVAIHLPVSLWLEQDSSLTPFECNFRHRRLRVHAPSQSGFDIRADEHGHFNVNELLMQLRPVAHPKVYDRVKMNGQFVKHADLLEIDFVADSFFRNAGGPEDPAPSEIEPVVRNIVARLRYTTGSPTFREFELAQTFWITRYMDDNGNELTEQPGLVRAHVHAPFEFTFSGLDDHSWEASRILDFSFEPQAWERLYLDAHFLLPEVGPALTLALAAVETAADQLIRDNLAGKQDEAESLIKRRRLAQRLDEVARQLIGQSLKDDAELWNWFNRLRLARNASSHAGSPMLDGEVINRLAAFDIIAASERILQWIQQFLLPEHRTHRDSALPQWQFRSPVIESKPAE